MNELVWYILDDLGLTGGVVVGDERHGGFQGLETAMSKTMPLR